MEIITITTDKNKLDIPFIYAFLKDAYWSKGRPLEQVKISIEHSMCFGMYIEDKQIGFARLLTDRAVFAYLMDVFIDEQHKGKGYGKKLMANILGHPELQSIKQWYLKTKDAQRFYQNFGFQAINDADLWMKKLDL